MLYLNISFKSARLAYNAMISRPKDWNIKFDQALFAPGIYSHVLRFELDESRCYSIDLADIVVLSGFANHKDYLWVIRHYPANF